MPSGARSIASEDLVRRLASLTPRERQVLELVATGMLNKQIAAELGAAEKTIKVHRGRIMEKMQVRTATATPEAAISVSSSIQSVMAPAVLPAFASATPRGCRKASCVLFCSRGSA